MTDMVKCLAFTLSVCITILVLVGGILTICTYPRNAPSSIACPICRSKSVLVTQHGDHAMYKTETGHTTVLEKKNGWWKVFSVRNEQ